ncbi:radical SAM protein [Rubellimicrobium roseum]|uniref:Radical SAM protein n=1 Tax=Rubellimicrobium roseum TaxID=687525 RepID=A0A5C4N4E9_9RHOB|nr:radical SAM protein [Rubellimicrobium roseum]
MPKPPDARLSGGAPARAWRPSRVLLTRAALGWDHGRRIAERAAALGLIVRELPSDRLTLDLADNPRRAYAEAKATLAVVVAPPSKRRLQPIAPSADWRVDLAEGCPAHCSYCYLAGSLKGPPVTRAYANLPEILAEIPRQLGQGTVTTRQPARAGEGTTYEASCYTDPLAIEHLTGSLSALVAWFGGWKADAQLRFTTKFDAVEPLLGLSHGGRTRMRASINPAAFARHEGGTSPVAARLRALRRMAEAGYPIGLTVAPIIVAAGWEDAYAGLLRDVAIALEGLAPDLTVELITHRYTASSKEVLTGWYPGSDLDMSGNGRAEKRTKFGSVKQVYDASTLSAARRFFEREIADTLPAARLLYFT